MLRFGFSRREPRDGARVDALKAGVRAALGLSEDVAVSINEITCPDPDCPIAETIVLVMRPGERTVAYKVHGGLEGLDPAAIGEALAASPRSS